LKVQPRKDISRKDISKNETKKKIKFISISKVIFLEAITTYEILYTLESRILSRFYSFMDQYGRNYK